MILRRRNQGRQIAFRDVPLPALLPLWAAGCYVVFFVVTRFPQHHWFGADAHAYWLTAHHDQLYAIAPGFRNAYNYSPAFAQLIYPIALLPWSMFFALWIVLEGAAFAWLLAPLGWRWAVPFWLCCTIEIGFGNIWGMLGVAYVVALRRPAAWAFVALTKVTPVVGVLWHMARREWRNVAVASATTAAVAGISLAIDPAAWRQWIDYLTMNRGVGGGLSIRLAVAAAMVLVAARKPHVTWLLVPALLIGSPHLYGWLWITILAAIPRLAGQARAEPNPPTVEVTELEKGTKRSLQAPV